MIRQQIVDYYKGADAEPSREEVATRMGLDLSAILRQLRTETPLDGMAGLSIEEAKRVLKHFGGLGIFAADIEREILDFDATRAKIQEFERKIRRGQKPPGEK
jgi:hypothetical protein